MALDVLTRAAREDSGVRAAASRAGSRSLRVPAWRIAALIVGGIAVGPTVEPAAATDRAAELAEAEGVGAQWLFDYDYDRAAAHYAGVRDAYPNHPTGPYHLATVLWTRVAQRGNGMRGSSLRNDRYFSQTQRADATREEGEAFAAHIAEAYRRADRMLATHPEDPEGLYYRGAAEALESGWAIVVDRAWFRAARTIRRATGRLRQIQQIAPELRDAWAVPGAYEYGIATLPRPLRMLAFLFGARGNRERGLEGVRITAEEGRRAKWGALWTWALLMQREGRETEALDAVRRLRRQFPRNPDFALEEIGVLTALDETVEAERQADAFLERRDAGFGNYHLAASGLIELRLGEILLFEERWDEAVAALSSGLAAGPDEVTEATLLFRRGNARDGAGRRGQAATDYSRVMRSGADPLLAEWAEQLRRDPWPEGAPAGSRPEPRHRE